MVYHHHEDFIATNPNFPILHCQYGPTWPPQGWLGVGSPEMGIKIYQKGNHVVGPHLSPRHQAPINLDNLTDEAIEGVISRR